MAQRTTLAIPNPLAPGQDVNVGSSNATGIVGLPVTTAPSSGSKITAIQDSASPTVILAANAARKGGVIFNTASTLLYLALSEDDEPSTMLFSYRLGQNGFIEIPFGYTGMIQGMWATDANDGAAMVTEFF